MGQPTVCVDKLPKSSTPFRRSICFATDSMDDDTTLETSTGPTILPTMATPNPRTEERKLKRSIEQAEADNPYQ
ncbi:hypothetical protein LTR95_018063 [Oleoguttula sp. CCFEE 5521]